MNQDLTVGKPGKVLWKFCIPLLGSIIFQQLYNLADSFVAGKFIGEAALAAVGNSYEITLIFLAFGFGCNIGCSVIVSQLFGAKKYKDLKTAVYTTLIASGALCLVLMVLGTVFCRELLSIINTPADIAESSALYLDIYIWGLPFVFYYNVSTGIFSALGDSKTPFYFLMCSSLANIGVDILFTTMLSGIFPGVSGVAWATFLCQGVSCICARVFVLKRLKTIETEGRVPRFSWHILGKIAVVAVPSILQQSFVSVGNILIQGVINLFGTGVIAGYSAAVKLNNLVLTSLVTLSNGISNFTAQNIGAGKLERVREGFRAGLKIVGGIALPLALVYFFGWRFLIFAFLDAPSQAALDTAREFLRILSPFYVIISVKLVSDGVLRGAKRMASFMISTFTDLALRVILAYVLSATVLGSTGIWLSWPIGWIVATLISYIFYKTTRWDQALSSAEI